MKVDKTVRQETINISVGTLILSMLMQSTFLIIGKWDITVLLGNLLGAFGTVLNFFLMGVAIQSVVLQEDIDIKTKIRASHTMRMQILFIIALAGAIFSCFNTVAVLIPLFFPRIIITCRELSHNKQEISGGRDNE